MFLIFTDPHHPRKCIVCTLVKMWTFMDGPLAKTEFESYLMIMPFAILN